MTHGARVAAGIVGGVMLATLPFIHARWGLGHAHLVLEPEAAGHHHAPPDDPNAPHPGAVFDRR